MQGLFFQKYIIKPLNFNLRVNLINNYFNQMLLLFQRQNTSNMSTIGTEKKINLNTKPIKNTANNKGKNSLNENLNNFQQIKATKSVNNNSICLPPKKCQQLEDNTYYTSNYWKKLGNKLVWCCLIIAGF